MRFLFFPLVPKGGKSNEVSGDENLTDWRVFCVSFTGPTPETFDLAAGFITSIGPRRTIETMNVIFPLAFPAFSYCANPVYIAPVPAFAEANVMPCNMNRKCFSVYHSSVQSVS